MAAGEWGKVRDIFTFLLMEYVTTCVPERRHGRLERKWLIKQAGIERGEGGAGLQVAGIRRL